MDRHVEVYAHASTSEDPIGPWECGSGYLLASGLVLTAAHVVRPDERPAGTVKVRHDGGELCDATVVWCRPEEGLDVALVLITGSEWSQPQWRHPVRFGRFVTGQPGQECQAVGFPAVAATTQVRDTHHAVGKITPKSLRKSHKYAMEVSNPPTSSRSRKSGWAGMSGAGVTSGGLLVGVVTTDPDGFDSRRLVVTPVSRFATDADFQDAVRQHGGPAPRVDPVELDVLAHRPEPVASPAGLLRADAQVVPFRARSELDVLLKWCRGDESSVSVRVVVGPGGQGKTRLAGELVTRLTEGSRDASPDWVGVFLHGHVDASQVSVLAGVEHPLLVVIDYAEGRVALVDAVLAAAREAKARVRVLLLARTDGAWRRDHGIASARLEVLADDGIVLPLAALAPDPTGRMEAWELAGRAFAGRLQGLEGYRDVQWGEVLNGLVRPDLSLERYSSVLSIHQDTLAGLLQGGDPLPVTGRRGLRVEDVLLFHEQRYWNRVANSYDDGSSVPMRRCLVALATLWGAHTRQEAGAVLRVALDPPAGDDAARRVDGWLSTLYGTSEGYWSGVQPDRLGEYLVASALGPEGECPDLIGRTAPVAAPAQLVRGLTVLGRAAPEHPGLREVMVDTVLAAGVEGVRAAVAVAPRLPDPSPILAAIHRFIDSANVDDLSKLDDALPRFSLVLGPSSVHAAQALTDRRRASAKADRDAHLPALAASVNTLANGSIANSVFLVRDTPQGWGGIGVVAHDTAGRE